MRVSYSTAQAAPAARKWYWERAVARTYFPLELGFRSAPGFSGELDVWSVGNVSISRNVSDGMIYRRHERHLLNETEESYLITVPEISEVTFAQEGKEVRCRPGAFLVERSHLPYDFSYAEANALWVLKVPSAVLRARIGHPERLATLTFNSTRGVGALFVDMIRLSAPRIDEMNDEARDLTGKHLVDLLAMAVEADDRVLGGGATSVKSAHLRRVERFVRANLADSHLSPQTDRGALRHLGALPAPAVRKSGRHRLRLASPSTPSDVRRGAARSPEPQVDLRNRLSVGIRRPGPVRPPLPGAFRLHAERCA